MKPAVLRNDSAEVVVDCHIVSLADLDSAPGDIGAALAAGAYVAGRSTKGGERQHSHAGRLGGAGRANSGVIVMPRHRVQLGVDLATPERAVNRIQFVDKMSCFPHLRLGCPNQQLLRPPSNTEQIYRITVAYRLIRLDLWT